MNDAANGRNATRLQKSCDRDVRGDHEIFDEIARATLSRDGDVHDLPVRGGHRLRLDGLEIERALFLTTRPQTLRDLILETHLRFEAIDRGELLRRRRSTGEP